MLTRAGLTSVVRFASARAALALACLVASGCAAPVLEYEDQFTHARIDNPDGDDVWEPADMNGDGTINDQETYHPTVNFQQSPASSSHGAAQLTAPDLRIPATDFRFTGEPSIFVLTDPEGNIVGNGINFQDLHVFQSGFQESQQSNFAQMRGMQVLRGLRFTNFRKDQGPPEVAHSFEVSTGARYFRLRDDFDFVGTGDIFGYTWQDTSMDNRSVGPQCTAKWRSRGDKWYIETTGGLLVGYHDVRGLQVGAAGEDLVPGAINRPASAQPGPVYHVQSDDQFSPLGEFDASASYQLTKSLSCRLGYNVFYAGNLRYAEDSINWFLPDFGIVDAPGHDLFQKTVYASVELLR